MESENPRRRSMRLKGYDYSSGGAYFVTICAQDRECMFGAILEGEACSNACGGLVLGAWEDLPNHYPHVELDTFVIMPNHAHGVIFLAETDVVGVANRVGSGLPGLRASAGRPDPTDAPTPVTARAYRHGLPEIVRALKSFSARRINDLRGTPGVSVWQRGYHDHIIRDEPDLERIRQYIQDNPLAWDEDRENPLGVAARSVPLGPREPWRV